MGGRRGIRGSRSSSLEEVAHGVSTGVVGGLVVTHDLAVETSEQQPFDEGIHRPTQDLDSGSILSEFRDHITDGLGTKHVADLIPPLISGTMLPILTLFAWKSRTPATIVSLMCITCSH